MIPLQRRRYVCRRPGPRRLGAGLISEVVRSLRVGVGEWAFFGGCKVACSRLMVRSATVVTNK